MIDMRNWTSSEWAASEWSGEQRLLFRVPTDNNYAEFDSKWREQVETNVSMWSSLLCEDDYLDGELQKGEIEKYICKL